MITDGTPNMAWEPPTFLRGMKGVPPFGQRKRRGAEKMKSRRQKKRPVSV